MDYEYSVYMLLCADDSLYIGVTNNVMHRVGQHQSGLHKKSYTYTRRPVKLVYTAHFTEVDQAIAWEHRIKRWSRKKKEALIAGEWHRLPRLSLSKTPTKELLQKCEEIEKDDSMSS